MLSLETMMFQKLTQTSNSLIRKARLAWATLIVLPAYVILFR
jgi:hypothetical protein